MPVSVQTRGSCSCGSGRRLDRDPDSDGPTYASWNVLLHECWSASMNQRIKGLKESMKQEETFSGNFEFQYLLILEYKLSN